MSRQFHSLSHSRFHKARVHNYYRIHAYPRVRVERFRRDTPLLPQFIKRVHKSPLRNSSLSKTQNWLPVSRLAQDIFYVSRSRCLLLEQSSQTEFSNNVMCSRRFTISRDLSVKEHARSSITIVQAVLFSSRNVSNTRRLNNGEDDDKLLVSRCDGSTCRHRRLIRYCMVNMIK